jgi:hypothetical protein
MEPEGRRRNNHDNEHEYYYFKDHEGRIQRIRRLKYTPRPGYIRVKWL